LECGAWTEENPSRASTLVNEQKSRRSQKHVTNVVRYVTNVDDR
jgi:hypothetical protein